MKYTLTLFLLLASCLGQNPFERLTDGEDQGCQDCPGVCQLISGTPTCFEPDAGEGEGEAEGEGEGDQPDTGADASPPDAHTDAGTDAEPDAGSDADTFIPCHTYQGLLGTPCEMGRGECRRSGIIICNEAGDDVICSVQQGDPEQEICDGLDNDCNGVPDENWQDVGLPCEVGVGQCLRSGNKVCSEDRLSTVCGAQPGDPSQEECDELDNDCDGEADEEVDLDRDTFFDEACGGNDCDDGDPEINPGAVEDCENQIDDNCNNLTDGLDLESCGPCQPDDQRQCGRTDIGECKFGQQTCLDNQWGPCQGVVNPTAETCDSLDNDCDGETDNGFALNEACTNGLGICQRAGVTVCNGAGDGVVCSAVQGQPAPQELCGNGLDDDCDGQADEGFDVGAVCSAGVGQCLRSGNKVCSDDRLSTVCGVQPGDPSQEECDELDNDCDGEADEEVDLDRDTFFDEACGGNDCDDGDPEINPGAVEDCENQIDDNCNNLTDGQDLESCGPCRLNEVRPCGETNIGECEFGEERCLNFQWGPCQGGRGPAEEVCNGLDDDCDDVFDNGVVDPGDTCPTVGVCAEGAAVPLCAGEEGWVCDFPVNYEADEITCNLLDDDCDGSIDEPFPTLGNECSNGVGICQRAGVTVCNEARDGVVCSAVPGQPAAQELCGNGLDDDCSGQTDEGFPTVGQECSAGIGECLRSGQIICDGADTRCNAIAGNPVAEVCNGLDDDCNSQPDNGFTLNQACMAGQGICQRGGVTVCNGAGDGVVCNAVPGQPAAQELCGNGLDDDCDNQTNEGFDDGAVCSAGVGQCLRSGNKVCSEDRLSTVCNVAAGNPVAETCNGLDDDCDGTPDEDLGEVFLAEEGGFCIDIYEASDNGAGVARSVAGVLPWSAANWQTATNACLAAGKRLCTKTEWCQAAGADANCQGRTYPWGEAEPNCSRANYILCGQVLKVTGSHPQGQSPFGVHDLAGNQPEWLSNDNGSGWKLNRGGGWGDIANDLRLTNGDGYISNPEITRSGFRCCRDVP